MAKSSSRALLARLFGASAKGLSNEQSILPGYADVAGTPVCVLGTCDGVYIDNEAALRLASHVIDCIERHPRLPIVMLVDSAGQEPNRVAEMLGLASCFGHLLTCLELARRKRHKLITVATGKAIGGAFICYGMFADRIYALDSASVGLMPVEAKDDVQAKLAQAIATATTEDNRAELGKQRGGRKLALDIAKKVLAAASR